MVLCTYYPLCARYGSAERMVSITPGGFEWDPRKAASNDRKHGVGFPEASTVFGDPHAWTQYDYEHSDVEDRDATVGMTTDGRIVVVVHTYRRAKIRIISARPATPQETRDYEQGQR